MLGDDWGIVTAPLKLLCYTILLAMISGFVIQGLLNVRIPACETDVERETGRIMLAIASIQQGAPRNLLYSDASDGCKRVLEVNLPESIAYLSLGSDPDDLKAGRMIVYQVQGCGKHVEYVDISISAASRDERGVAVPSGRGLLLKSGRYLLTFEFVHNPASGERWVIVY